ncbi:NUDIX hydrolase [Bacillus sp. EAC]|uniref:NUDIX hydrolase n=1 Tax=Bacillus sp. EAC TaxID=1978338 RepID=UPI000B44D3CE|nr:NUDIX domain-containing protein [Bacillus sp. EAC]
MGDYIQYIRSFVGKNKIIMVASGVFIIDSEERVLLQLRSDINKWGYPGGFMELGEKVVDTVRREAFEETGLNLGNLELLGIYSGTEHECTFPNGDQAAVLKITFICKDYDGAIDLSNEESLSLKYFPLSSLPDIWENQKPEFEDLLLRHNNKPFIR